jgi:hypothetical protein
MKPIDKAIYGMVSEPSGRNESERIGGLETRKLQGPGPHRKGGGDMGPPQLTETVGHSGGVLAAARYRDALSNWRSPPSPAEKSAEQQTV